MKKKLTLLTFISTAIVLGGCGTVINKTPTVYPKNETCAIAPFVNFSETPLAGQKAASILYGVLKSKNYKVTSYLDSEAKDYSTDEIENFEKKAANHQINCFIGGYVNEWRYKTGIDAEPAVSVTVYTKNLKTGKTISTVTISETSLGHKSIGVIYQNALNKGF